ncbi:MAG TPA: hypothetical protein VIS49_00245 [Cyclobacteriaceae bacterium]
MSARTNRGNQHEQYEFINGNLPVGFKELYELSLYNTLAHRELQSRDNWHSYHIIRRDKKNAIASIHFCVKKGVAHSPYAAPFGFFELWSETPASLLFDFIAYYESELRNLCTKRIVIKSYPESYHTHSHNLISVLFFNHHYIISNAELGASLSIDKDLFTDRIDPWEKRKLKQALKAKLRFEVIPNRNIKKVYQFIRACRNERGYAISMSLTQLVKTIQKLDRYFHCFGVYDEDQLIAASICVRESKNNLYNFYSAHGKESDSLSPIVFLISELYTWCQHNRIKLLDLGTSALGGIPNFSLIDFKLRLGASPTMKLTFEKELK